MWQVRRSDKIRSFENNKQEYLQIRANSLTFLVLLFL